MDKGITNKVYINPKFNQEPFGNASLMRKNINMHVNPTFASNKVNRNIENNKISMNRRIFVNPNFIGLNNNMSTSNFSVSKVYEPNKPLNTSIREHHVPALSTPVSKSRYTLIRKNDFNILQKQPAKVNTTVKIGRFKIVQLNHIRHIQKTGGECYKTFKKSTLSSNKSKVKESEIRNSVDPAPNSYKRYVKINKIAETKDIETKIIIGKKILHNVKKNLANDSFCINSKVIRGKYKKNNIPCPLFVKYGKCLRNIHGSCEFLHDKKHVSVCRKFLKGICHDNLCLFSHELSSKKMPTCYFYLKGMCTKENCPYLHVKLNEKAKICNDFLKGYCENGDKCVHRHVNKDLQAFIRHSISLHRQYSCTSSPIIVINKAKTKIKQKKLQLKLTPILVEEKSRQCTQDGDNRYFEEENGGEHNDTYEVIKPRRCKLGMLPSFIKL